MRWGIVVLAAGTSTRMGRPKMVLPWGGTTVLGKVLETLAGAMGGRRPSTIVVTGGDEEAVRAEVTRLSSCLAASCASNPDFRNGEMMDSLRVGLRNLPPEVECALVALGDQPQLSLEAARRVIEAAERSVSPIVVPVHGGRKGHPWAIRRPLWASLAESRTARDFLDAHQADIERSEADATALKDLDSPEDYERDSGAFAGCR